MLLNYLLRKNLFLIRIIGMAFNINLKEAFPSWFLLSSIKRGWDVRKIEYNNIRALLYLTARCPPHPPPNTQLGEENRQSGLNYHDVNLCDT